MAKLIYADIIMTDPKYQALADLSQRLPNLPIHQVMTTLIDLLGDEYTPLLAEKWSVTGDDGIMLADSMDSKRRLIARAIELHRQKGTPWAVREVLRQLGFGEIEIDEGLKARTYEHTVVQAIPTNERWAWYSVRFTKPITNDQAEQIRRTLRSFTPARCLLAVLDYKAAPIRYNKRAKYDGSYNHGSA